MFLSISYILHYYYYCYYYCCFIAHTAFPLSSEVLLCLLLTNSRHLNLHVLTFINQSVLAKTCFVLTMMYSVAPKGTLALIRLREQKCCLYSCSNTTSSPIGGNERRLRRPVSNESTCLPARHSKNGITKYPGTTGETVFVLLLFSTRCRK